VHNDVAEKRLTTRITSLCRQESQYLTRSVATSRDANISICQQEKETGRCNTLQGLPTRVLCRNYGRVCACCGRGREWAGSGRAGSGERCTFQPQLLPGYVVHVLTLTNESFSRQKLWFCTHQMVLWKHLKRKAIRRRYKQKAQLH